MVFIAYTTVEPNKTVLNNYVKKVQEELLDDNTKLWLIGRQTEDLNLESTENITIFNSIDQLVEEV